MIPALLLTLALPPADFDRDVAPLLARRCLDCHSGPKPKGKLDLTRHAGAKGALGKPGDSPLWARVHDDEMPPKKPLSPSEKAILKGWLDAGAPWGSDPIDPFRFSNDHRAGYDWWSLQPVRSSPPPSIHHTAWPRNAIDRFVLAKLEARGLTPSPEADRRTLIRRLTFDLTGLPPTPAEVVAFTSDPHPDAYERVVDRLLASPAYGERHARHWLDVVRFGESDGFERDLPRFHSWPYRDWVVQALNADLPYDEFVRLQLAGDALRPDDSLAATGFLVAGAHDIVLPVSETMKATMRQDELEDLVGTVGQTFLGLTVHCARCHDHKFDPVSQKDYYRLVAALADVKHGERTRASEATQRRLGEWLKRREVLRREIAPIKDPLHHSFDKLRSINREIESLRREIAPRIYAVNSQPTRPTHVLLRGNVLTPGERVEPGVLTALADTAPKGATSTARRVELARWVTEPNNPLFARVAVNRLWQHHFGVGLVDTPSDFGFNGGRPSHPELLDYLARELVTANFGRKHVHRLIVTSAAYRQASRPRAEALKVDADNRLLWRKSPTRLEAEAVRDAILAASGQLDRAMGGPPYFDFRTYFFKGTQFYDALPQVGPEFARRSLYRMWARGGRSPFLDTFDCPDPSATMPRRAVTTTPLQALTLFNNAFVLEQAERLAERVRGEAGGEVREQVRRACQLVYGREAEKREVEMLSTFVTRHGLEALGRVLLNTNEFVQVD